MLPTDPSTDHPTPLTKAPPAADDAARVAGTAPIADESLFRQLAESMPQLAWIARPDGWIFWYNRRWYEYTGTTPEQMEGWGWETVHDPAVLPSVIERWQHSIRTGTTFELEFPLKGADDRFRLFLTRVAPVRNSEGTITFWFGTNTDVEDRRLAATEREQMVRALEAERANLVAMVELAPTFMVTLRGPTHVFELANENYYLLINRRNIIGKTVLEALPEIEAQGFIGLLDEVYRTGTPFFGNDVQVKLGDAVHPDTRVINFVYQALRGPDDAISGIFVHGVDVTADFKARAAVEAREAEFRQLADTMPQIVWGARPDGVLDYYNQRWFEFLELSADSEEATEWSRYVHPDDFPRVAERWSQCLMTGEPYSLEFRVRNAAGNYRNFLVRALPVRDESGAIFRWYGTCTDIEQRILLEARLERLLESERGARAESEAQSRMKDEFLATLSHEIRTPLNAILGWSHIARKSTDPNDVAHGLGVIERNARAQSQIIDDLLDMSRIISGKVRLDVQRLDLAAVVRAAVDTARPTAEAKGVRLDSVIDPLQGLAISGDANRMQQILWNLISNAIKFTPKEGKVRVVLERVNSHLEISVIDSGEGIKAEFIPFIFDRFRQADASTTRRHGGLGLGLSIVKQLVELHGGSVRVSSAGVGNGTTFNVALPFLVVQGDAYDGSERRHHPRISEGISEMVDIQSRITGVKVLVIDDEPDARALVARILEDCDAIVTATDSIEEAVRLIENESFDVLISDIGMPGEDGYSLIKRIRQLKRKGRDIPAIALTAYARAEDRVRAVSAGFLIHVAKPVEPLELVTMVAAATGRTGAVSE